MKYQFSISALLLFTFWLTIFSILDAVILYPGKSTIQYNYSSSLQVLPTFSKKNTEKVGSVILVFTKYEEASQ